MSKADLEREHGVKLDNRFEFYPFVYHIWRTLMDMDQEELASRFIELFVRRYLSSLVLGQQKLETIKAYFERELKHKTESDFDYFDEVYCELVLEYLKLNQGIYLASKYPLGVQ